MRRLLVLGATAVIQQVKKRHKAQPGDRSDAPWLVALLARKPDKLAAMALANKTARII